jgi:hypothetical protein
MKRAWNAARIRETECAYFFKKLNRGHVRHKLLCEDDTVIDILDEAEFEVTDATGNNVLRRRILEKM